MAILRVCANFESMANFCLPAQQHFAKYRKIDIIKISYFCLYFDISRLELNQKYFFAGARSC